MIWKGTSVDKSICVWESGPVAEVELHPQELICSGLSNWADWDPEANYWAERVSDPATGGTYLVHFYKYIFSLVGLKHTQPGRGAGWGHWYCLCWCEHSVCDLCGIQVYIYAYMWYVWSAYVCLLGIHFSLAAGWTLGHGAAAAFAFVRLLDVPGIIFL